MSSSIKLPKIFLDAGDPDETKKAKGLVGHIDGQTTNPTLVARHPEAQKYIDSGKKFTHSELLKFYKEVIVEIEREIAGPISIEVEANWDTKAADMLKQATEMATWARNAYIKFPTIPEGIKAAHEFVATGGRVNMTLVFDQVQSAAVYVALRAANAKREDKENLPPHFLSPFLGRYDDRGIMGLDIIKNIIKMYKGFNGTLHTNDHPVQILASSIRTLDHFYGAIFLGADAITTPLSVIRAWVQDESWIPDGTYRIENNGLKSIVYDEVKLRNNFEDYPIERVEGSLLDDGVTRFAKDWQSLLK